MRSVGVSAVTGEGTDELLAAVAAAADEYKAEYLPQLTARRAAAAAEEARRTEEGLKQFRADYAASRGDTPVLGGKPGGAGGAGVRSGSGGVAAAEGLVEDDDDEGEDDRD